jgi:hypothetical protein
LVSPSLGSTDKPSPTGKPRRSVFQSETFFGDNTDIDNDVILEDESFEFEYDIDTTPAELQAYAMNQREQPQFKLGSRMPITRRKALSEKAKQICDTMEDDDKALILALQENWKDTSTPEQSKYSANTHSSTTDKSSDDINDALIAIVTSSIPVSRCQAAIQEIFARSFLSLPSQSRPQFKTMRSMNGHTYVRQANSHDILYNVSQASRKKKSSLPTCLVNIEGINRLLECNYRRCYSGKVIPWIC